MLISRIEQTLERLTLKSVFRRKPPVLSPQGYPYATFNRRMFAATVDAFLIMFLVLPFNEWIVAYAYRDVHVDSAALEAALAAAKTKEEADRAAMQMQIDGGLLGALGFLFQFQFTLFAVYSFVCWHFWAATPGKLLMGLRIVHAKTGVPLNDWQSIVRIVGYLAAGIPAMLGYVAINWSKKKQGWHDKLANTVVIVAPRFGREVKSAPPVAGRSNYPESEAAE